jgi:Rieske Fe-S protein
VTPAGNAETGIEAETESDAEPGCVVGCRTRRSVLAAVGAAGAAAALAGCETYGGQQPVNNPPIAEGTAPPAGATAPAPGGTGLPEPPAENEPPSNALADVSDIPVGGGVVFADKGVVITQPKDGTIKAFSATCTHAGCAVNEVSGGTINCPCHGSKFKVADGSVKKGPANRGLSPVGVKVSGSSIVLT